MRWGASVLVLAALASTAAAAVGNADAAVSSGRGILASTLSDPSTSGERDDQTAATHDRTLKPIFNNIDWKFPNAAYWCCGGIVANGPNAKGATQTLWPAQQFWPSRDATATEIDVAANLVSGTNTITVGLYADSGGVPGTLLASFKPTLLHYHSCCKILVGKLTSGVPLKMGTPYWIALTTDSTQTDTSAEWNFNMTDQVNGLVIAGGDDSHWLNDGAYPQPGAFGVYGP